MPNVNELLALSPDDVSRLSRQELAKVVSQLASAGNKRLRRLEQTKMGTESRAYKNAMAVGNFSVAGKKQGQLQNEYKRVSQFLKSQTSSVSGWKSYRSKVIKRVGGEFDSEESERAFWRAYRDIASSDRALHKSYGSTETQRQLRAEMSKTKQLSKEEREKYRELFPDDKRSLTRLSDIDLATVRTQIEMAKDYESQEQALGGLYGSTSALFKRGKGT